MHLPSNMVHATVLNQTHTPTNKLHNLERSLKCYLSATMHDANNPEQVFLKPYDSLGLVPLLYLHHPHAEHCQPIDTSGCDGYMLEAKCCEPGRALHHFAGLGCRNCPEKIDDSPFGTRTALYGCIWESIWGPTWTFASLMINDI